MDGASLALTNRAARRIEDPLDPETMTIQHLDDPTVPGRSVVRADKLANFHSVLHVVSFVRPTYS